MESLTLPLVSGNQQMDGIVNINFNQEPGIYDLFVYDESINQWLILPNAFEVTDPVIVYGCTDEEACNYDENANVDDGTCGEIDNCGTCHIPFCVNLTTLESYFIDIEDCNYIWLDLDCENNLWCLSNQSLNSSWNLCDENIIIEGCIDEIACNYNATATNDDGSCIYAQDYYDCDGNCLNDSDNDGICDENEIISNPPWDTPIPTSCNATIALSANTVILLDELPITNGDVLAVFYEDDNQELQCGGLTVWNGDPNVITVWGDDNLTDEKDGFADGEEIVFMAWDSETDEILTNVTVDFQGGVYTFSCNGLLIASTIDAMTTVIQQIALESGWYIFSTYVEPEISNVENVVSEI